MFTVCLPLTQMSIHARIKGPIPMHELYEGEAVMSQDQQDYYKSLVGDGLSKVTVARDNGEKDFGNGGGVMVSVTLTCDQSQDKIRDSITLAHQIADSFTWYYQNQLKQQLVQAGILH